MKDASGISFGFRPEVWPFLRTAANLTRWPKMTRGQGVPCDSVVLHAMGCAAFELRSNTLPL